MTRPTDRTCSVCGETFIATTARKTCGPDCARVSYGWVRPPGTGVLVRGTGVFGEATDRSVMMAGGITVTDPAALHAGGVRLVDGRGQPWEPIDWPINAPASKSHKRAVAE